MRDRSRWLVAVHRLGEEPVDRLLDHTSAEERLAMVAELSAQAWLLSGRPWPTYLREDTPVVVRPLRG